MKKFFLLLGFLYCLTSCSQNRTGISKEDANEILQTSLTDFSQHNAINRETLILKDEKSAVEFAEKILFDVYGAQKIKAERPYKTYNIDGYWIISGTLEKGISGGTFLIIIDAHDCRIVRLTHEK